MSKAKPEPIRIQFDFRIFLLYLSINPFEKLDFISLEQSGNHVFCLSSQRKFFLGEKLI